MQSPIQLWTLKAFGGPGEKTDKDAKKSRRNRRTKTAAGRQPNGTSGIRSSGFPGLERLFAPDAEAFVPCELFSSFIPFHVFRRFGRMTRFSSSQIRSTESANR